MVDSDAIEASFFEQGVEEQASFASAFKVLKQFIITNSHFPDVVVFTDSVSKQADLDLITEIAALENIDVHMVHIKCSLERALRRMNDRCGGHIAQNSMEDLQRMAAFHATKIKADCCITNDMDDFMPEFQQTIIGLL